MESRNKRKYNDDLKKMVVELYHTGSSVSMLSSEYGVSEVTFYNLSRPYASMFFQDYFSLLASNVTVFLLPIRYNIKITIIKAAE